VPLPARSVHKSLVLQTQAGPTGGNGDGESRWAVRLPFVDPWDPSGFAEAVEDGASTAGISGALIKDVVITTAKGVVIGGVQGHLHSK